MADGDSQKGSGIAPGHVIVGKSGDVGKGHVNSAMHPMNVD